MLVYIFVSRMGLCVHYVFTRSNVCLCVYVCIKCTHSLCSCVCVFVCMDYMYTLAFLVHDSGMHMYTLVLLVHDCGNALS